MDFAVTCRSSRHLIRWALSATALIVAALVAVPTARAQDSEVLRYAVIVAHNGADDARLEPLEYADDDGVLYLRLLDLMSTRVELLTVLDDDTQRRHPDVVSRTRPPTHAVLQETLTSVLADIEAAQRKGASRAELLFIYVGHGNLDAEGKGYVHLLDGRLTRSELFHQVIARSTADFTHIIVDACYAYSLVAGRGVDEEDGAGGAKQDSFDAFLAGHDLTDYPSTGVLIATTENRETHEWSRIRSGIFSHQIRSALAGAADVNSDGLIEYSEISAFVDAANAELARVGKRVGVFAWPPQRDRHAPLLDIRSGPGLRHLVLRQGIAGRYFIETTRGDYWAEFHKAAGQQLALAVPRDQPLYLRDGQRELQIPAGNQLFEVTQAPTARYSVAQRGAVDKAFEEAMFAVPFSLDYYRGFISGRSHMLPVATVDNPFFAQVAQVEAALEPSPYAWRLGVGYLLTQALILQQNLEHGAGLRVAVPVWRGLELTGAAELGYAGTGYSAAEGILRASLLPGIAYRWELWDRLSAAFGLELGYTLLAITGERSSLDPAVGTLRGRVEGDVRLFDGLVLIVGGGLAGHIVTVDGREQVQPQPAGFVGLGWRGN